MAATSSDKIDVLIYGPVRPILENGFPDSYNVHHAVTRADLEALPADVKGRIRGLAVTFHTVTTDAAVMAMLPKLEMIASFGVGYDHIAASHAGQHGIIVTNTPDVLTEEVADVAMGLLIATCREFIKADRFVRSGEWTSKPYPLSVGSLRDRTIGMVGMGRIGQAIARRLEASLVPVVYHSRKPAEGVANRHYPDLLAMAKDVDTLVVIVPGGDGTNRIVNAEVLRALGPRGVVVNVARGSVIDEPALIEALKTGTIIAAGLDVFEKEPSVPDELKAMDNVVLLPHIGSAAIVTRNAMDQLVVDNLKTWFAGKPPLTPVPETPVRGR
jgi:lactate dehydrogenase-like 2-hydroxyacid dehydrogenase